MGTTGGKLIMLYMRLRRLGIRFKMEIKIGGLWGRIAGPLNWASIGISLSTISRRTDSTSSTFPPSSNSWRPTS